MKKTLWERFLDFLENYLSLKNNDNNKHKKKKV